jgi:hypothetical protein
MYQIPGRKPKKPQTLLELAKIGPIEPRKVQTLKHLARITVRYQLYRENKTQLGDYKSKVEALQLPITLKTYVYSELIIPITRKENIVKVLADYGVYRGKFSTQFCYQIEKLKPNRGQEYIVVILHQNIDLSTRSPRYLLRSLPKKYSDPYSDEAWK